MNNIPEGYKQTEVGVIPVEWEVDKIKNITSITTGAKNTQDKIDDGEYPFYVRSSIIERINSYSFDGEAVLTAGDGVGTGKVIHYINGKFDFHQRVYKISDFSEKIDGYFFYLFFSNYFLKRIMSMTAKSSVDSVRMEYIIVHEMVHLLERNHNNRFVAYMDKFMPQWHFYKEELNRSMLNHEIWSY